MIELYPVGELIEVFLVIDSGVDGRAPSRLEGIFTVEGPAKKAAGQYMSVRKGFAMAANHTGDDGQQMLYVVEPRDALPPNTSHAMMERAKKETRHRVLRRLSGAEREALGYPASLKDALKVSPK